MKTNLHDNNKTLADIIGTNISNLSAIQLAVGVVCAAALMIMGIATQEKSYWCISLVVGFITALPATLDMLKDIEKEGKEG